MLVRESAPTPGDAAVPVRSSSSSAGSVPSSATARWPAPWWGCPAASTTTTGRLLWAPHLPDSGRKCCRATSCRPPRTPRPHRQRRRPGGGRRGDVRCRARRAPTSPFLTISTGIGAGVVNSGRLLRGRRSLAEVGHTVIDWRAWREGRPSTLEELGSGSGVARLASEAGSRGPRRPRRSRRRRVRATTRANADLAGCDRRLRRRRRQPRHVVLPRHRRDRGRPGSEGGVLRPAARDGPGRPEHYPDDLAIVPSALGDDAGLAGAAAWEAATKAT